MIRKSASHIGERFILGEIIIWFLVAVPMVTLGQNTDHHNITINVQPVTLLQINVSTVRLNITGADLIAGQDQMTMTDQSTTIMWGTNVSHIKISVKTDLAVQKFVMTIRAVNPTVGTGAPKVTLSTVDHDLILDIGRSAGSSTVRYTGIALASQGSGSDIHTMTFTIQSQ